MARYRFGPLGRMMLMDLPGFGWQQATETVGAIHSSLDGTRTRDVFGHKRRGVLPVMGVDAGALSWLEMAYRGALGSPLYFQDLQRINRLGATVSTTLSAWSATARFTADELPTAVDATVDFLRHTAADRVHQMPAPYRAASWTPTTLPALLSPAAPVPVHPGEQIVFSVYHQSGVAPALRITPLDRDLVAGAPIDGASIVVENLSRYYQAYTVPTDGSVAAVLPSVRRTGAGTTVTIGWQLEVNAAGVPTTWVMGEHAAAVIMEAIPQERRGYGAHMDGSYTLLEV